MIRVGFGTNNTLKARLIRWATKSQWSHCWIEYPSRVWGGDWVIHSHKRGVVKVPLYRVYNEYTKRCLYECEIPNKELMLGFQWAANQVGKKYDYAVIWHAILLVLFSLFRFKFLWNLVVRDTTEMTCSEFVSGFVKATRVEGTRRIDPELTTPGMLQEFCEDSKVFSRGYLSSS